MSSRDGKLNRGWIVQRSRQEGERGMKWQFPTASMWSLIVLAAVATSAAAAERPNIILCMADDLGWGDVGFNGNQIIQTPHLDSMAESSLQLKRFYAAAPVCSPTRGSALTGRHPYRYGVFFANTGHLPAGEVTLAELLQANGYVTGHFGKWHLGTLTRTGNDANRGGNRNLEHYAPPWQHGFDVCFSTESKVPTWDPLLVPRGKTSRTWWDPVVDRDAAESYGTSYWNERGEAVTGNMSGDDSRVIMDRAVPFIEQAARRKQPFLAVIWFHAPHLPVVAGPEYAARYARYSKYEQHYYGCITALDEQIGRLRQTLKTTGVSRNTLLWFCSDNGPEGQAGKAPGTAGAFRGRKRDLYEGGIRVPALVEWPAVIEPGISQFPASTLDYLPTIHEILGRMPPPPTQPHDGQSLLPLLRGESIERQPLGFESAGQVVWMDQRFKLIQRSSKRRRDADAESRDRDGSENWELYDLVDDPTESRNLAGLQPERVAAMAERLKAWRASCSNSLAGHDYKEAP